ncbi:MAG: ParB/RepB/Spo0J family partition protein [Deltaproteobacteria bacterium]|nr:ParB/RepB/Spo0J family partition protein [Deltaproteobacteria bacterium]
MAATEPYVRNQLYLIPLAELLPDPNQPRKFLDPAALDELAASITQHGVLEPVLFRVDNGLNYVVAGERRCAATRQAGLASVPAIFIDSQNHTEISLVENLLRQNLTAVEEAEALGRLQEDHKYQQDDLTRIFGKSKATISETLSLNKLPQEIRDECRTDPSVPKRTLIEIARNKQQRSMTTAFARYKAQQQKAAEGKKTRAPRRTKAEGIVAALSTAGGKIADLDMGTLSTQDKSGVIEAVESLRHNIDDFFTRVAQ